MPAPNYPLPGTASSPSPGKMAAFFFALLLFFGVSGAALMVKEEIGLPADASFPAPQAERLIRALNLVPKEICADVGSAAAAAASGRLVEKRVRFPGLSGGGPSVEELGHHAGYYRLPHSHAASELALFYENGPFSVTEHMSLAWNDFGWDKQCEGKLCYDFSNMEKFLNQQSVRDALGVGDIDFVSCSPTVSEAMMKDWMRNLEVGIPALLEDGIKLLVYAGEYDLICNWLGHMVPMDQPKAALEMLRKWTHGELAASSKPVLHGAM
ncbi:hypothetical protein BHE74_00022061 [Ensete ventricosum]|nr:hypothetical protein BHE74_00022061 [Ensete ventricosum]